MEIKEVSGLIVDCAFRVRNDIGPGLLETVYEVILADALREKGLSVERQKRIPIKVGEKIFAEGFCADLVVDRQVLVEIKSVRTLEPVFKKQVRTYLKFSGLQLGLLINFGGGLLKGNIERIVLGEVPDLHS